ncbi:hypothetical protein EF910_31950 [Streptomyces sp. WAC07149]|uniref:zinc finger domain-containing protein n=1 Tax=Streptomyces sp. WAC07149 TaxID=2487425 RepID=UPI000F7927AB|nr:hypothetical protein [Streptomyces sp. WAC07149]RST00351.1 hypothetical protein EF910_31950 [Streptomyces sp. WAC07149]
MSNETKSAKLRSVGKKPSEDPVAAVLLAASKLRAIPTYRNYGQASNWIVPARDSLLISLADLAEARGDEALAETLRKINRPRCTHVDEDEDGDDAEICAEILRDRDLRTTEHGMPIRLCPRHYLEMLEDDAEQARRWKEEQREQQEKDRARRERILKVPCERCEAPAGQKCRTAKGVFCPEPHDARCKTADRRTRLEVEN